MKLYAWIGEDEHGSGVVGLKQARMPAGYIPLVCIESDRFKLEDPALIAALQRQADTYGKRIRFAEFELTQDGLIELPPGGRVAMSKTSRRLREAFAELDALYAQLPTIACQGKCAIACGPIHLTDLEAERLRLTTHKKPRVINDNRCIYLTAHERCSAYAVRPLICRAWGLLQMLSCMHGCVPDRWLTPQDYVAIARAVERIGGGRILRTTADGLGHFEGESFASFGPVRRSDAAIERNDERTRALRALYGGHILCAVDERDE